MPYFLYQEPFPSENIVFSTYKTLYNYEKTFQPYFLGNTVLCFYRHFTRHVTLAISPEGFYMADFLPKDAICILCITKRQH